MSRLPAVPRAAKDLLSLMALVALVALVACTDRARPRDPERDALPIDSVQAALARVTPSHIDSVFPADEEARRFRIDVGDSTDTLRHAAPSRARLMERFQSAVEANDRAALQRLAVDAAEFGSLVYLTSRYSRPPYFLKPQTAWFQLSANSDHDAAVLLRKFGGQPVHIASVTCADAAIVEGRNRLWDGCRVRFRGDTTSAQLFGLILERDRRFKFLSLANKI